MKNFENYFNSWINDKVEKQLKAIDIISYESGVNSIKWFKESFIKRQMRDYSGDEFLDELLENFVCQLSREFDNLFGDYLPYKSKNIYNKKSHGTFIALRYNPKSQGVEIDMRYETEDEIKEIEELIRSISIEGKIELMKNKLFYYIINKTKLDIFSKKDIRYLKLKNLDNYELEKNS